MSEARYGYDTCPQARIIDGRHEPAVNAMATRRGNGGRARTAVGPPPATLTRPRPRRRHFASSTIRRRAFPAQHGRRLRRSVADNPTRFLCVEPDPETGAMRPVTKRGRPVYLYLCREEREVR